MLLNSGSRVFYMKGEMLPYCTRIIGDNKADTNIFFLELGQIASSLCMSAMIVSTADCVLQDIVLYP